MASELFVDNITGKTGTSGGAPITLSGNAATLGSTVTFPSRFPIQVVNKNFSDNYSHSGTSNAFVAVSGFTQTFTLTSSTNKVLVLHEANLTGGIGGEIASTISNDAFEFFEI